MLFLRFQVIPEDRDLSGFMYIAAFLYFGRIEDQVRVVSQFFSGMLGATSCAHTPSERVGFNYNANQLRNSAPVPPAEPTSSTTHIAPMQNDTVIKRSIGRRVRIPTRKI